MVSNPNQNPSQSPRVKQRGFASMDPTRQREIASQGGRAAHEQGVAHEFSPEEARAAGRKGGESVSRNREHMAEIGRKGGESSGGGRGNRAYSPAGSSSAVGGSSGAQHHSSVIASEHTPPHVHPSREETATSRNE